MAIVVVGMIGNQVRVLSDPVTVSSERASYSIANPIMREGEAPQRTVSQETCLIREMGFRVKHRIQQGKNFPFGVSLWVKQTCVLISMQMNAQLRYRE